MSDIRIIGPDGSRFVFPAGTSREVMLNAMRRRYTGQERREREQTRDMILNSQLPGPGRAGVQEYLSRDQMRQDLAQARESNIAAQEAALIPEDTTRERFYTGAQGVTLGAAPLIQGATVAPMAALLYPFLTDDMRGGRSLGEFVSDMSGGAYQRARTDIARAREERPIESLALETAGGLFTGKTAYDALGERFLRNRAAARGGVVGTGAGAQYGFLESEGDPGQTAQAAGIGGLFGAPVGKAIEGIADIGGRMFQRSRGMEAPEPVAEPEPLPVPQPGRGYLGRRVFDNPPRPPNPRTEAERATWAPTATVLEQARTRASEAKAIADQTLQTRRPEDIARVKDQKKALIADIEATMAQREGMNTPDDQRLADALSALSMETSDPVFISTQLGVAQRNLDQVMINQGMRPEPMRTPVQTVPPFRPTPSREQQARTIEGRPSRTRYAGGTPPKSNEDLQWNTNQTFYIGSPNKNIKEFKVTSTKGRIGQGVYATPERKLAEGYTKSAATYLPDKKGGGKVYEVYIRGNLASADDFYKALREAEVTSGFNQRRFTSIDELDKAHEDVERDAQRILQERGFTGFVRKHDSDRQNFDADEVIVFDPENVRRADDPMFKTKKKPMTTTK